MTTTLTGRGNASNATAATASDSKIPNVSGAPTDPAPKAKNVRKPRVKPEGLAINFLITDPAEIAALNKLASADRRTPENYVSLVVYKTLTGHIASAATEEAAGVK